MRRGEEGKEMTVEDKKKRKEGNSLKGNKLRWRRRE